MTGLPVLTARYCRAYNAQPGRKHPHGGERKRKTVDNEESISWGELAELTHETQVARFGFCTCEDNEGNTNPYEDCPTEGPYTR